ncbi:hypothetical protein niasHT_030646 [Heterodera trifolii]|uniref:Actin interacting protein 3-like C-terminal domain-containing protein n=1 Tax=Heterodera trifolii TaxID=157864 RepID=A0ABD2HUI1_9BILA
MLLNCIRNKAGHSHRRCSGDILSLPFSDDPCEDCVKMAEDGKGREMRGKNIGRWKTERMELLERDQPPLVPALSAPSVLAPFPAPLLHHFPSPKHSSLSQPIAPFLCNGNGHQIGTNGSAEITVPMNGTGGGMENVQPPRPARSASGSGMQQKATTSTSRATLLLQQLRERKDEVGVETLCANGGGDTARMGSANHVFLEFQGETKRSALPTNVRSVEQIKSLFLRSFPSLSPAQLRSPGVKVYIQNAHSPHRLFYELEDIREVGNHSVLKLFEQSLASSSSPRASTAVLPTRPPRSVPAEEYFSEPDMADWTISPRMAEHGALRPASVQPQLDEQTYGRTNGPKAIGWREHASDSWQSSSAYSSDSSTSGPYARSGTTTPVHVREDQHTQRKVDSLERQLASLSELVRSALLPPRELSSAHWRELSQFHTDIVGFSGNSPASAAAIGPMSESVSSTASNATLPLEKCTGTMSNRKAKVPAELAAIRADLEALRSETIRNALRGRSLLEQTLDRMRRAKGWPNTEQDELERRKSICTIRLERLQRALREFEQSLENTRAAVLNSTRRLHLNEVDQLTSKLGEIGREAVEMKMEMPTLHRDIDEAMRRMMERLEGEERFLREKVPQVDGCLRRCKTLANVMVTMKKLAMVQDERDGEGRATRRSVPDSSSRHIAKEQQKSANSRASTVPSSASCNGGSQQHNHPLDAILDELSGNNNNGL